MAYTTLLLMFGLVVGQEEWLFIGPGEGSFQSEVLSLPLGSATCGLAIDPLPEFIEREGAVAALLGGLVTVCNTVDGWFNVTQDIGHRTHCFSLDPVLGTWAESIEPLPYEVYGAEAISLPNGDMMIMGGYDEHTVHTRTSIYSLKTKTWGEGPAMPIPRALFCTVPLNTTHTFITGGENDQGWVVDSFIFDGVNFHQVTAPQYLPYRGEPGCALLASGEKVMVAGGLGPGGHDPDGMALNSVEIYDVAANSWSLGPSLPVGLAAFAGMVARQDKVILFGGNDGSDYTTKIHSLGSWEEGWTVEEVELNEGRGFNPSLVLDETNMLNC